MTEPTVIANQAHLPGLRMPGHYNIEWDHATGLATVIDGSEAGTVFRPSGEVAGAIRRALDGHGVINESVETYTETPEA